MKTSLEYTARRILVDVGKALPFVLCFVTVVSHVENLCAIFCCDYVSYNEDFVLNTPISYMIGDIFQYDILLMFVAIVLSVAVKTCFCNKLCLLYLLAQLAEKHYYMNVTVSEIEVYVVVVTNLIIGLLLTYFGTKNLIK